MSDSKKKTLKIVIIFVLVLLACFVGGYFTGKFLGEAHIPSMTKDVSTLMTIIKGTAFGFCGINIVACVLCICMYYQLKKKWKSCTLDDEGVLDQIEYKGNIPMIISSIALVLNMLLFTVFIWFIEYADKLGADIINCKLSVLITFATYIFGFVWVLIIQGRMVALEKKMNPEKKGHILDFKFEKDWINSCDEAQKGAIYRSAYSAFKATNFACLAGWVVSFLCMLAFDTGLLPVILVTAIYLISILSFQIAAMKFERPVNN